VHDIDYEEIVRGFNKKYMSVFCYIDWSNYCKQNCIEDISGIFSVLLELGIFEPTADDCTDYALDYYTFIIKNT
jgi:hypothetical protein